MNFDELIKNVLKWADDKSILKSENAPKQMLKVMEEVGETAGALAKGNKFVDLNLMNVCNWHGMKLKTVKV